MFSHKKVTGSVRQHLSALNLPDKHDRLHQSYNRNLQFTGPRESEKRYTKISTHIPYFLLCSRIMLSSGRGSGLTQASHCLSSLHGLCSLKVANSSSPILALASYLPKCNRLRVIVVL